VAGHCKLLECIFKGPKFRRFLTASDSWNPLGHTGPVTGLLYLFIIPLQTVVKEAREF
jgi:hypothetical protein